MKNLCTVILSILIVQQLSYKCTSSIMSVASEAVKLKYSKINIAEDGDITVLTFNIWNSGMNVENGLMKIAKHILYTNPDIVALQEVMGNSVVESLIRHLGPDWTAIAANSSYPDVGILTRHEFLTYSDWIGDGMPEKTGHIWARIKVQKLNKQFIINFWNLHLDWHDYGPYAACNKLVTNKSQLDAGEYGQGRASLGRAQQAYFIINSDKFQRQMIECENVTMIVAGDFNCPSHLDWIDSTRNQHCDWVYAWPATQLFHKAGFHDAFRVIYPDAKKNPGNTWSSAKKSQDGWGNTIKEPQDRIDFILYKSNTLHPLSAKTYVGSHSITPEPHHYLNDWPSDHRSVLVQFKHK
ncbi:Uncharacterized protein T02_8950 [Trichinella nativa]|uniref:Endonuclease/exonuclease/phosphatase domain-containing protein n=2 Tax=Trichinella TaxID=6333 RepID=A0A0V1LTC1_9BILA|nr:Uncharacterized protein T06_3135 [Trichinella sp. T6]KRZ62757.1 Uncharacterized protein T02_8950 [Trichinella nativa]